MKIYQANWILPVSAEPFENGAIAVKDGKILAVGKFRELRNEFPEAEIQDFGEAAILPAFVNAHSHLELSALRGFLDASENDFSAWLLKTAQTRDGLMSAEDVELSAVLGSIEGAKAGVTCFGDIGKHALCGMKALQKIGLRGVSFQENDFGIDENLAQEKFLALKEKVEILRDFETELVKTGISPHAPYTVSAKLFELLTDYSLQENLPLTIHAAESQMEEDFMRRGSGLMTRIFDKIGVSWRSPQLPTIEYLHQIGVLQAKPLLAHCVCVSETDVLLIAESGAKIAHCPKSNAKFGHGIAPLQSFLDKGVKVGLGSDSVASNNSCDLLEEARFAAMLARIKSPEILKTAREVLELSTLGGAKCLNLEKEIGSLEAGKSADFVVVSLENLSQKPIYDVESALVFATNARDVRATFVRGKAIYENGALTMLDENEINAKLQELQTKIVQ